MGVYCYKFGEFGLALGWPCCVRQRHGSSLTYKRERRLEFDLLSIF